MKNAADRPARLGRWFAMAAAAAATFLGVWQGWFREEAVQGHTTNAAVGIRPATIPGSATVHLLARSPQSAAPGLAAKAEADPLGHAPDLRRIYDDRIGSADARQRRIATRAFDVCVPTFLAGAGQTPSPDPLIQSLPAAGRAEREAAYRDLFARCHRFLAERRDVIANMQQDLRRDVSAQDPGSRAQQALLAGRSDEADALVAEAFDSADPASIAGLDGIAVRLVQSRGAGSDEAQLRRARAVDAALPWVACDLGLDCSPASLGSLQLCAVEGLCEGDFAIRLSARQAKDGVDAVAVGQERARLLALLRSGRGIAMRDLLP